MPVSSHSLSVANVAAPLASIAAASLTILAAARSGIATPTFVVLSPEKTSKLLLSTPVHWKVLSVLPPTKQGRPFISCMPLRLVRTTTSPLAKPWAAAVTTAGFARLMPVIGDPT